MRSAVILAGGEARRANGKEKYFFMYEGKTFIERLVGSLSGVTDEIVIVARDTTPISQDAPTVWQTSGLGSVVPGEVCASLPTTTMQYVPAERLPDGLPLPAFLTTLRLTACRWKASSAGIPQPMATWHSSCQSPL